MPYKFTSKELDPETGLYYYGARYYDAQLSRWVSTDPALNEYLPVPPNNDKAKERNKNLPGMGGVFNSTNINLYHYVTNNPVKYYDPDGRFVASVSGLLIGMAAGGASALLQGNELGSREFWAGVAAGGTSGLIVGLAVDSVATFGITGVAATALVVGAGTVGGGVSSVVESGITGEQINALNVACDALIGGVSAYAGVRVGRNIVNKFEQQFFRNLSDKNSALYKAMTKTLGGTKEAMNILKSSKFKQMLATKGADFALGWVTDVLQDKANPKLNTTKSK